MVKQQSSMKNDSVSETTKVCVVIVNYNSAEFVVKCLESLASVQDCCQLSIVVVDACSQDDSLRVLAETIQQTGCASYVRLLPLSVNRGFAFSNNEAIRAEMKSDGPDYFWLLNPDTEVRAGALQGLLKVAAANEAAGVVGSRLFYPDGRFQNSAFRFHNPWNELQGGMQLGVVDRLIPDGVVPRAEDASITNCDWVSGASMLVSRRVLETIGLMDDGYFLYFEEVDYCFQARKAGWEVWWTPESNVVHHVGQTTGMNGTRRRRPAYWFRSRARYFSKNHGWFGRLLADAGWLLGHLSLILRTWLTRRKTRLEEHLVTDFFRFSYSLGHASK